MQEKHASDTGRARAELGTWPFFFFFLFFILFFFFMCMCAEPESLPQAGWSQLMENIQLRGETVVYVFLS